MTQLRRQLPRIRDPPLTVRRLKQPTLDLPPRLSHRHSDLPVTRYLIRIAVDRHPESYTRMLWTGMKM
jgi:hypothetical protein